MFALIDTSPIKATIVSLEVAQPAICETGSLSFARNGFFGECFDLDKVNESGPVSYSGVHRLEIRTLSGTVVFSYTASFTSNNNPIDVNDCSYVSYGSTLSPAQMNGIVHGLSTGTYQLFTWSTYSYTIMINGLPVFGSGTAGSNTVAVTSVTIDNDDIANELDLETVVIDGIEQNVYPVYACNTNVSVDFHMLKVDQLLANQYTVTSSWAEVSNCNQEPAEFSDPASGPLFILQSSYPQEQILRLGNLLSSNVLEDSPFEDPANIGKNYKIKFVLSNGRCDPVEVVICVLFSDEPVNVTLNLQTCFDPNFPDCTGVEVSATTTAPGPLMAYLSAPINLQSANGYVEEVIVQISDNMGNCLHSSLVDINPTQFSANNKVVISMATLSGINLRNIARGGITNLVVHVIPLNACSTCITYDAIQDKIIEIPCDFSNRLNCTYDDPADIFYEEDSNSNIVFELLNWQNAIESSNFRLNQNVAFRPVDDTHVALESETGHDFIVYPNPFSNELNYRGLPEGGILTLMDAMGRVIMEQKLDRESAQILSTDRLIPGVYFYSFIGERHQLSGRLVKN